MKLCEILPPDAAIEEPAETPAPPPKKKG